MVFQLEDHRIPLQEYGMSHTIEKHKNQATLRGYIASIQM